MIFHLTGPQILFFSECAVSFIVNAVSLGKLGSEEDTKEEFRMEREPPATHEEGTARPSVSVVINLKTRRPCGG